MLCAKLGIVLYTNEAGETELKNYKICALYHLQ